MKKQPHFGMMARLAAVAAMMLPSMVLAQGQIDMGRANDASNRIGSGGRNSAGMASSTYTNWQVNNGNRIVTGNVTMGREFRDSFGSVDPYSFRGNMPSAGLDSFTRNTVGVPQAYTREAPPNVSVPFYGATSTVQTPPGFVYNATRAGYIPTPGNVTRTVNDQRLGVVDLNQPIAPIPVEGQLITRGSLNAAAGGPAGIITASSLYGFREWNPNDAADRMFLENLLRQNSVYDRAHVDPRQIRKMRDELNKMLENEMPSGSKLPSGAIDINPFKQPFDAPADPNLKAKPITDQLAAKPFAGDLTTGASMRHYVLGAARKTSSQYSELNKRLEQYYADRGKTDSDFAREFNAAMRAKMEAEKKKTAIKNPNEVNPNVPKPPEKPAVDDPVKPKKKPQPLKVNTLTAGVKAEGLSNLMKKAEALMKDGKFASAMDQYDAAEAVSPNNPLIWLGRANAKLGAGFFVRADADLRQAFMTDKALLMGQYDLTGMLGEERLGKIVAELKDIANKDTKPMPVFLLAYIAYNTGHERQAAGYLDLAEKRAEGKDIFLKMVREHWALPDEESKPDTRKPEQNK